MLFTVNSKVLLNCGTRIKKLGLITCGVNLLWLVWQFHGDEALQKPVIEIVVYQYKTLCKILGEEDFYLLPYY